MSLTVLQYNHKPDSSFCAPNSLYLQINSMVASYIDNSIFSENISLDDIARRIGFQKSTGSKINTKNLSKLSNGTNKLIKIKKLKVPKLALSFISNSAFFKEIGNVQNNKIYTICVSFSQYQRFLRKQNYFKEYYKSAEKLSDGYIQHCITIIVEPSKESHKCIIIGPNIELTNEKRVIDISQLKNEYTNKIEVVDENEIKTLLTMRYDGLDDDNIIIDLDFEGNSNLDMY